ncbi:MAG: hypothetical protein KDA75_21115, partial [Planctomycetaceae bacterium]|nr:hypothetical protein [Planctomycetaceae bacterium]
MSDAPPAELCLDEAHSDAAFLSGLRFAPDAPDRLLAAARKGRPGDFVRRLADNSRSQRQWPSRTVANACIQASWLLPAGNSVAVEHLTRETLLAAADGLKRKAACNHVAAMLDAADQTPHLSAEVTAAWLTLIPTLASRLDGDTFFRLWRRTLAATERIVACEPGSSSDPLDVSPELQDEILFRAGCVFAPLADASHWLKTARHNWRSRLDQTDEEHVCPALAGRMLIAWVGSLTRTTSAAFASEVDLWKKRHVRLLRQLARDLTALLFANRAAEAIH